MVESDLYCNSNYLVLIVCVCIMHALHDCLPACGWVYEVPIHLCIHEHGGFLVLWSTLFLEACFFIWSQWNKQLLWLVILSWYPLSLLPTYCDYRWLPPWPSFYTVSGDLIPCSHTCMARALFTSSTLSSITMLIWLLISKNL